MTTTYKVILSLSLMMIVCFSFAPSAYSWLYYSKPEFRGRVIDAETKQPVEDAVVVVLYEKWEFGGPGGGNTFPIDAKETLTDQSGDFYFPTYKTLIGPLSRVSDVSFIIFKPGYMSLIRIAGLKIPDEKYFAIGKDMLGKEGDIKYVDTHFAEPVTYMWKGLMGIVELKKAKTREEKWRAPMVFTSSLKSKDLPLLFKAIEEAEKDLKREGI